MNRRSAKQAKLSKDLNRHRAFLLNSYHKRLGDKAAAFTLVDRAIALHSIEKDAANSPQSIDILARIAARVGEPDRAIAALQKILSIPDAPTAAWLRACRQPPRSFDSIQCSTRCEVIRASRNWPSRNYNGASIVPKINARSAKASGCESFFPRL